MVDNIPILVHQKAVPPLPDADIIDVAGNSGKAQVQRHPGGLAALSQGGGHSHHPGVVALKNGLHMGRRQIECPGCKSPFIIKGKILENFLSRLPAG